MRRWVIFRFINDDEIEDCWVEKVDRRFWTRWGARRWLRKRGLQEGPWADPDEFGQRYRRVNLVWYRVQRSVL